MIIPNEILNEQKQFIYAIGNAAHEIRNMLAQKKKADVPELNAIDQIQATTENQSRQLAQIITNDPNGCLLYTKPIFRNIFRSNEFVLRIIDDFKKLNYICLDEGCTSELKENIISQNIFIKQIDKKFSDIYTSFISLDEVSLNTNNNDQNAKETINANQNLKEFQQFLQKFDFSIQPVFKDQSVNLQNLTSFTKEICNSIHNVQNLICTFQNVEQVKKEANQINGHAGNIENQLRAMLQSYEVSQSNPEQIKKVVQNQCKVMKEELKKLQNENEKLKTGCCSETSYKISNHVAWITQSQQIFDQVANNQKIGEIACPINLNLEIII